MSGENKVVGTAAAIIGIGTLALMYWLFRGTGADIFVARREPPPPDPLLDPVTRLIGRIIVRPVWRLLQALDEALAVVLRLRWPIGIGFFVLYVVVRFIKWAWTD